MKVLVIAPHPDDESLGCGGTLCLHAARGDRVFGVCLSSGELGLKDLPRAEAWKVRESEGRSAAKILGLAGIVFLRCPDWGIGDEIGKTARALRPILKREAPDLIYLPHPGDWHPDHKAALSVVQAALAPCKIPKPALRGYEIWTPLSEYDHVEDITSVLPRKVKAIRAHQSQVRQFPYERAARGLNQYRGALAAKSRYAEVFLDLDASARDR